jgi:D-arabinose 1-dehydrogenase-like Zn-dependent alcohol dehydrogenase
MKTMKAIQVSIPRGKFELVERPLPAPGSGQVRIKVEACGICHSDQFCKDGLWPGLVHPRIPGHEVAGRIDEVGSGVSGWKAGERVGVGWHGGHCFDCPACRGGDFVNCERPQVSGLTSDGGYAQYMVARQEALARIPESLDSCEAAPLLCAGVTTFNSLRNSGARAGDLVAIQGIGGLGHLAIQFAAKMGFRTVALSSGQDKQELARRLGAHEYVDSSVSDPVAELKRMGGAQVILATAPNSKIISPLVNGLKQRGKLLIVAAAADPLEVVPIVLLSGKSVAGWPSGHARDSEDALNFSALTGAKAMIETFPLEKAEEAYQHMMTNKARFRVVLTMK